MSSIICQFDHKLVACKVIESMGYQGGDYVKAVEYKGRERIVVRRGPIWKPKTAMEKIEISGGVLAAAIRKGDGRVKYLVVFAKNHMGVEAWKIKVVSGVSKNEVIGRATRMASAWKGWEIARVDFHIISKKEIVEELFKEETEG